jgi:hypothetical protein
MPGLKQASIYLVAALLCLLMPPGGYSSGQGEQGKAASQDPAAPYCVVCNCTCSRPLNDSEWGILTALASNEQRCQTCKLAGQNSAYNCFAYTIGVTNRWIQTEPDLNHDSNISVSELTTWYANKHISGIAFYGKVSTFMEHVAKKSGGKGSGCSARSKLGGWILLSHDANQLQGSEYGTIQGGN